MSRRWKLGACVLVAVLAGCSAPGASTTEAVGEAAQAIGGSAIASIALANVGKGACSTTSTGGKAYESSCTGNGGQPEYWCADFAMWVWQTAGADVSGLDAAAGSFYVYGQKNGTLSNTPVVGDAVVFDYQGGGVANHVAIVTQVNSDGTIESVSGDWNGQSGTEAEFASTSSVVQNVPAYASTVGGAPSVIGMTISGYVAPVGLAAYAAKFVSQSFPFATSALTMKAGETVASYIELKNTGTIAWDAKTRLATSQPRDRASAFADPTWVSPDRPAAVSGTVAVGGSFTFVFDLRAPDKPGTYFEYFSLVEEGVAWFSDPGQGGPADDDLEVQIVVVAAPGSAVDDAGSTDGGAVSGEGEDDAQAPPGASADAGGLVSPLGPDGSAPPVGASDGPPSSSSSSPSPSIGGCAIGSRSPDSPLGVVAIVALALAALTARRRSPTTTSPLG